MIKLEKGPKPVWLTDNAEKQTEAYKSAPKNSKPTPWKEPQVVEALRSECHGKCMYCEGVIDDVSYIEVEHIAPKSEFVDLVLEWTNLGLACSRCNKNKGDYWSFDDPEMQLLNPYSDPVDNHLKFMGPLTFAVLGSTRGLQTINRLKLTRSELFVSKSKRVEDLHAKLELWHREHDPGRKSLFAELVDAAISPDQEFSAALRAYAQQQGYPVA